LIVKISRSHGGSVLMWILFLEDDTVLILIVLPTFQRSYCLHLQGELTIQWYLQIQ